MKNKAGQISLISIMQDPGDHGKSLDFIYLQWEAFTGLSSFYLPLAHCCCPGPKASLYLFCSAPSGLLAGAFCVSQLEFPAETI